MTVKVAIVRDHSVSMRSLSKGAMEDFNSLLYSLQEWQTRRIY